MGNRGSAGKTGDAEPVSRPQFTGDETRLATLEKGRSHSMEVAEVWESPGGLGPGMRNRLVGPILPG